MSFRKENGTGFAHQTAKQISRVAEFQKLFLGRYSLALEKGQLIEND